MDDKVKVTEIYLREFLNAAAVKAEAVDRSGSDSSFYHAQMKICATVLCLLNEHRDYRQLIGDAEFRASEIFRGQDWRRELDLYDNLYHYMTRKKDGII